MHEHQVSERALFIAGGRQPETMALMECTGCPSQPWQVRDRDGQVVRFYSDERGSALFRRIARSRTKIVPLMLGG